MSSFKRGFQLAGQSWRVLRSHRGLVAYPILGVALGLVLVGPPGLAGAYLIDRSDTVPGAILVGVATYLISFVTAFTAVALAYAADAAMRDQHVSVREGLAFAGSRLPAICGWALVNALLTLVLRALESRGELASIAAALVGGAWSVISLLVVPAIAFENAGPVSGIKRSASLFKQHWGGRLTGMAAIGGIVMLLGVLPSVALIVGGGYILSEGGSAGVGAGAVMIAIGLVGFAASAVISSTLRQVFAVALYRYATAGEAPQGFSASDLEHAVRSKRGGAGLAPA